MNNCDNYSDREFVELLLCALDGAVNEEQFNSLQKQIVSDGDAQELYYDFLITYAGLSRFGKSYTSLNRSDSASEYDDLLALMAEHERTTPATIIPKEEPPRERIQEVVRPQTAPRHVNKFSLYAAIISIAAMAFALIYVQIKPPQATPVATITDSIDAQWAQSKHPADIGSALWNNEGTRWLHKGIVKIEFDYGAEVIIEGPTAFEVMDAEKMILQSGRLYATVPKAATGFTVQTPYSTIIDLGTEFGVKVDHDGTTDVHMLKGKASLIPGASRQKGESRELAAGQANRMDTSGQVKEIQLQERVFVRRASSQDNRIWRGKAFDLADVVGGGNGFGAGGKGHGINMQTGEYVTGNNALEKYRTNAFQSVSSSTFIDGIFIPKTTVEEMTYNSQGDTFTGLSYANGTCWGDIVSNLNDIKYDMGKEVCLPYLNGTLIGTAESPYIYMHSNAGITFSLDAIRASIPAMKITKFSAKCGMPDGLKQNSESGQYTELELDVLIDGKIQYQELITKQKGGVPVELEIEESHKYLTLVVTEGSDTPRNDLLIIAEPQLQIE